MSQTINDLIENIRQDFYNLAAENERLRKELEKVNSTEWISCSECARNIDNGGMYSDGRTRCPIQEHYALPKDGHCHLAEPYKEEQK